MGRIRLIPLANRDETLQFGREMAQKLPEGAVLALTGDLGAGKTTFVQGLGLGLGIVEPIQSPTFVLLNLYDGLYHFDLYRLKECEDFFQMGFQEYFDKQGICAIEWPERIEGHLPQHAIHIHFAYDGEKRVARIR